MEDKSVYNKIWTLISRNDFTTAEKLMEKHDADLDEGQKKELREFIAAQKRQKQKETRKREKRLNRRGHWGMFWTVERGLFICWIIIGIILYPYSKMEYFTTLSSWDGPPFERRLSMELLFLLDLFLMFLFCCIEFFQAHQMKDINREAKRRAEKSGKDAIHELLHEFQSLEKRFAEKRKGWLIAMLVLAAFIAIHVVSMVRYFM